MWICWNYKNYTPTFISLNTNCNWCVQLLLIVITWEFKNFGSWPLDIIVPYHAYHDKVELNNGHHRTLPCISWYGWIKQVLTFIPAHKRRPGVKHYLLNKLKLIDCHSFFLDLLWIFIFSKYDWQFIINLCWKIMITTG